MSGSRRTNNPTALPVTGSTRADDFLAFDALPAAVRAEMCEQVTKLSSASVLAYYRSIRRQAAECGGNPLDAEVWTLRRLHATEGAEIDRFAAAHQAAHGIPLAHVAADATVQRYAGSGTPRRARTRRHPAVHGMQVIEVTA